MLTGINSNSSFHRFVLGVVVFRRDEGRPLVGLDSGPIKTRHIVWGLVWRANWLVANFDGGVHVYSDKAQPNATRSASSKTHDVHAACFLGDVLLLPIGLGSLLGGEQHSVNCSAVAN